MNDAGGDRVASGGYRQCVRCVLDTDDRAEITFDADGVCNHCRDFDQIQAALPATMAEREEVFRSKIDQIKRAGIGRPYDSILGVSGGVDSSYLAYIAKREGLRPLVVHFDNGWNSELAVRNIQTIVERLEFDLHTYVINWNEFRELQLAYLRASVIDIEALTDHAIYGALFRLAIENRIPFVLSGNNVATEGVLPYSWIFNKFDSINIRDIHRKFGRGTVKTYPFLDRQTKKQIRNSRIETVTLLDYIPYVKDKVKQVLVGELGWRDYGGKHYESIFTRFYQGYILPTKFGVDKRKAHLSSLICAGQMTREEALRELESPGYDEVQFREDREFVLKKLGLARQEFDDMMREPVRDHREFRVEGSLFYYYPMFLPFRPVWN
ncbi:MAG: N-acetyl sugar amidotransferase, partial [Armatimonadetes bacterium]|nr:N-acetyl sugar amidotransferase [Armatimonadota bacterium]